MKKSQVFLWTLYDFANSISVGVFSLYFSQWLVIDKKVPDLWFNMIFVGATLLLIFSAPIAGSVADKTNSKIKFLRYSTLLQFVFILAASLIAVCASFSVFNTALLIGVFLLANYFYQLTFTFYNPMLRDIAPAEKQGLVSGIGQVGNFLGYIFGLAITLPFATGIIYWFGVKGRAQTFLPAAVLFMVVVLPALLFLRNKEEVVSIKTNLKEEFKNYFTSFLKLVKVPGMGRFLLAFFFFNDAVLTAVNNFPIFVDQVFGVSDGIKTIMAVGIFGMAAVGAIAGGLVGDKVGLKKALLFVLSCWVVVFPVVALVKNFIIFSVISCLIGLLYGASLGIARAVMVYLSPKESINHAFSYYNLFERFSTLIGPLAWGLTASMLVNFGPLRYRIAIGVMGLFVFAGLLIVKKIPADKRV